MIRYVVQLCNWAGYKMHWTVWLKILRIYSFDKWTKSLLLPGSINLTWKVLHSAYKMYPVPPYQVVKIFMLKNLLETPKPGSGGS